MTATDVVILHEKLDAMNDKFLAKFAELNEKLSVHIATEEGTSAELKKKLDEHLQDHKDEKTFWRKGIIGAFFTLIGSFVVWGASLLWNAVTHGKAQ